MWRHGGNAPRTTPLLPKPPQKPPSQPPLVYIADDSAVVRSALERRLTAEGVRVHSGGSAADSRSVTTRGFACALLDLDLGDGNGVDVAELLRVHQRDLAVAFFSAGASDAVTVRARALGPVFRKPEQLEDAVAWVLGCCRR
jgi:DNA-binding response OmpR family regulator